MASEWGTAIWGTDRWAALTFADLLLQQPTGGGSPTGQGDWNLTVEILLPEVDAGIWGISTWDESDWAALRWEDITERVRGMEWRRGSDEVYGRPRIGTIFLTLDDNDGQLSPWTSPNAQYLGPGTVLRCGLVSATGIDDPDHGVVRWLPQWAGLVDTWAPVITSSNIADRRVEVRCNETLRDLAQVDDPALPSPVGSGETADVRTARLLDAAAWRYGLLVEAQTMPGYPLQSTEMAQNRIAECYLTADSSDTAFRSLRDGRAGLTASEHVGTTGSADPAAQPQVLSSWYETGDTWRRPIVYLDRYDSLLRYGALLTEAGDYLLQESGDRLLITY